jgi:hypothetical protein
MFSGCCEHNASDGQSGGSKRGGFEMGSSDRLTPEESARITEMQDMLIELYVEQREALERGQKTRASEIESEIKGLHREIEDIKEWSNV